MTWLATAQVRAARGLPDDLVRISAGIEDVDDLLAGEPAAAAPNHAPARACGPAHGPAAAAAAAVGNSPADLFARKALGYRV